MQDQGKKDQKITENKHEKVSGQTDPKDKLGGQANVGGRQQGGVQGNLQGGQRRPGESPSKPGSAQNRGFTASEDEEE